MNTQKKIYPFQEYFKYETHFIEFPHFILRVDKCLIQFIPETKKKKLKIFYLIECIEIDFGLFTYGMV